MNLSLATVATTHLPHNPEESSGPHLDAVLAGECPVAAFAGICLYAPMANRRSLERYLPLILKQAPRLKILLGDWNERHNLEVLEGVSEAQALSRIQHKATRARRYAKEIIAREGASKRVEIVSMKSMAATERFGEILREVEALAECSEAFRTDGEALVQGMLERSPRAREAPPQAAARLLPYVWEEIAAFILLYEQGCEVEFYPGDDITPMRRWAVGAYPDAPIPLTRRTHVSVRLPTAHVD